MTVPARPTSTFAGVPSRPIPSLLRNFSAPVRLEYPYRDEDLMLLMAHDSDSFTRWDAKQDFASEVVLGATAALQKKEQVRFRSSVGLAIARGLRGN